MNAARKHASEDVEALLPWHAAGTLGRRDAQRVKEALAQDEELARRYALVCEELAETIHLNETLGAPSARAMEKLFRQIDAEAPRPRAAVSLGLGARLGEFIAGFSPRALAWSATAAAAAVLLQAGIITTVLIRDGGNGFQTASQGATASATGSFVLLRFAPQATAGDITAFLRAHNASLVDGPRADGFYKVRIAEAVLPQEQVSRIVQQMQQDRAVGFIVPAE